MFFVYAISSHTNNFIYVGFTSDLSKRLIRHNSGRNKSTKPYRPFSLIYLELCHNRAQARAREVYFKGGSGKEFLKSQGRAGLPAAR